MSRLQVGHGWLARVGIGTNDEGQGRVVDQERLGAASGVVRGYVLFEALTLSHKGPLQDDAALLITLAILCGELIDPAQFAVAVLAADVTYHVSARQHHPILDLTVLQVDHLVKQERSPCGPSEACGYELRAVGQDSVTVGT